MQLIGVQELSVHWTPAALVARRHDAAFWQSVYGQHARLARQHVDFLLRLYEEVDPWRRERPEHIMDTCSSRNSSETGDPVKSASTPPLSPDLAVLWYIFSPEHWVAAANVITQLNSMALAHRYSQQPEQLPPTNLFTSPPDHLTPPTDHFTPQTDHITPLTDHFTPPPPFMHTLMSTKHPVMSTENPMSATEHPVVPTEHLVMSTENLVISTENPVMPKYTDHTVISTEHPLMLTERPVVSKEHSVMSKEHTVMSKEHTVMTETHVNIRQSDEASSENPNFEENLPDSCAITQTRDRDLRHPSHLAHELSLFRNPTAPSSIMVEVLRHKLKATDQTECGDGRCSQSTNPDISDLKPDFADPTSEEMHSGSDDNYVRGPNKAIFCAGNDVDAHGMDGYGNTTGWIVPAEEEARTLHVVDDASGVAGLVNDNEEEDEEFNISIYGDSEMDSLFTTVAIHTSRSSIDDETELSTSAIKKPAAQSMAPENTPCSSTNNDDTTEIQSGTMEYTLVNGDWDGKNKGTAECNVDLLSNTEDCKMELPYAGGTVNVDVKPATKANDDPASSAIAPAEETDAVESVSECDTDTLTIRTESDTGDSTDFTDASEASTLTSQIESDVAKIATLRQQSLECGSKNSERDGSLAPSSDHGARKSCAMDASGDELSASSWSSCSSWSSTAADEEDDGMLSRSVHRAESATASGCVVAIAFDASVPSKPTPPLSANGTESSPASSRSPAGIMSTLPGTCTATRSLKSTADMFCTTHDSGGVTPSPVRGHGSTPVRDHGSSPVRDHGSSPVRDHGSSPVRDHGSSPVRDHGSTTRGYSGNSAQTKPAWKKFTKWLSKKKKLATPLQDKGEHSSPKH